MSLRKALEACDLLIHLGVVFHGAGTQRIEPFVVGIVQLGEAREVAHHLPLGELRKTGNLLTEIARIQSFRLRPVPEGCITSPLPGHALLEEQPLTTLVRIALQAHSASLSSDANRSI